MAMVVPGFRDNTFSLIELACQLFEEEVFATELIRRIPT